MKVRYIGNFPPPYGGVTIKNRLLYNCLSEYIPINKLSDKTFFHKKIKNLLDFVLSFFPKQILIIGISAAGGKSLFYTRALGFFSKSNMKRSLYFMMGGVEAERIAHNRSQLLLYGNYKTVFVETKDMLQQLLDAGMKNVELYPNCRKRPLTISLRKDDNSKLKCLFFSKISKMKGVDIILNAAKQCSDVDFFFYGDIDSDYTNEFLSNINNYKNTHYMGVFSGEGDEVYNELIQYDLLLLPTRWKTEGVPGIVIECKMVGIPAILSNVSHNSELITSGDGLLFDIENELDFIKIIQELSNNREKLEKMKKIAFDNSFKYDVSTYLPLILKKIQYS